MATSPRDAAVAAPPESAAVPTADPHTRRLANAVGMLRASIDGALTTVGDVAARTSPTALALERVSEALADLRACPRSAGLLEARNARLRRAVELVREACRHFARGSRGRAADLVRAKRFRGALGEWQKGSALFLRANRLLPRPYSPSDVPLPAVGAAVTFSHVDPVLSDVASALLDLDAAVRCWTATDWKWATARVRAPEDVAGFATLGDFIVHLGPGWCHDLAVLLYDHEEPEGADREALANAVGIFAHEVMHHRVGLNEAVTECRAVQLVDETARSLGATPEYADHLAAIYARDVHPTLPPEYRSDDCRPGGALDRTPDDGRWP